VGIDEIQRDLDQFLEYYNLRRSHEGYHLAGGTPPRALQEALGITELPPVLIATEGEEVPSAAWALRRRASESYRPCTPSEVGVLGWQPGRKRSSSMEDDG